MVGEEEVTLSSGFNRLFQGAGISGPLTFNSYFEGSPHLKLKPPHALTRRTLAAALNHTFKPHPTITLRRYVACLAPFFIGVSCRSIRPDCHSRTRARRTVDKDPSSTNSQIWREVSQQDCTRRKVFSRVERGGMVGALKVGFNRTAEQAAFGLRSTATVIVVRKRQRVRCAADSHGIVATDDPVAPGLTAADDDP